MVCQRLRLSKLSKKYFQQKMTATMKKTLSLVPIVSRTFGDCEAKLLHMGGMKGVVSCEPEIIHEIEGVN